jgi:SAM-dependent methyltransferase
MQTTTLGYEAPRFAAASPYQEFAQFYDRVMGDATARLIGRNFERSRRRYGIEFASAADIGCGTGRLLLRLSRHCNILYGVDSSSAMLAQARRRTRNRDIRFLRQDLCELRLPRQVDLITCTFDTLNYLTTPARLKAALRRVSDNLRSGGHFIADLITGAGERMHTRCIRQRIRLPNASSNWVVTMNGPRGESRVEMSWLSKGENGRPRRWREVHLQKWHPLTWMCRLLQRCGLSVRGVHNADSYEPASARTFWVHLVACK